MSATVTSVGFARPMTSQSAAGLLCAVGGRIRQGGSTGGCRLADIGLNWDRIGVDFETAQNELEQQAIGMYLALSQRAYTIVCSASHSLTIHYTSGLIAEVPPEDRELIRAKLEEVLDARWPGYVTKALTNARPGA